MDKSDGPLWYERYFGPDYLLIDIQPYTAKEVDFLFKVLGLGKGEKILDVSCGYGRHLLPLYKRGINIYGADLSLFMLERTAEKINAHKGEQEKKKDISSRRESRLVQSDNRALPFCGVFDCAINMFNSFGYFESEQDNFRMLVSVADSLKPGGLFMLDLVNRDFILNHLNQKDWYEQKNAVIFERKWFEPLRNRTEIDVSVIDSNGRRNYHHSIRLYSFTELRMLLEAAGFMVKSVFGGFDGEEFDIHHDRMLILSQSLKMEE
jgi:SAM-dependent methyltransferase